MKNLRPSTVLVAVYALACAFALGVVGCANQTPSAAKVQWQSLTTAQTEFGVDTNAIADAERAGTLSHAAVATVRPNIDASAKDLKDWKAAQDAKDTAGVAAAQARFNADFAPVAKATPAH